MRAYRLSKSKIVSGTQCPKRLYLEVHRPELIEPDEARDAVFAMGNAVGEAARRQFPQGVLIKHQEDLAAALKETAERLSRPGPATLFEATFQAGGVLVRCDVLQKDKAGKLSLIEIKSSAEPKPEYDLDVAVQAWVIARAGYKLRDIQLGYINRDFVYRGNGDYTGLFAYQNMRKAVRALFPKIPGMVRKLQRVLAGKMPTTAIGKHCFAPCACPFISYCWPKADYPVINLPRIGAKLWELLADGYTDIRDVPPERFGKGAQTWVQSVTRSGKADLKPAAQKELAGLGYPRYYLDFETVTFAVPIWADTRPYEALPFQFSCHVEKSHGHLMHREFLHADGTPPMRAFAEAVIEATRGRGPVLTYSAYEKRTLSALAQRFPDLEKPLSAIIARLADLLPIVQHNYYHPAMQGSWSIKAVLPTIAPELDYGNLGEVHEGGGASAAIESGSSDLRRHELREALLRYCERDTLAMVEVAHFLQGGRGREKRMATPGPIRRGNKRVTSA